MAALPDDRVISEITIPGTHDCASQNAQLGFITKCQALDVAQQLNIGARYLDIRLGEDESGELRAQKVATSESPTKKL